MTINKIAPRARTDYGLSWTTPARERPFDLVTGKYPDGTLDITHLPSSARIGILQQQFPEGLRDKIYFMLVYVEGPESGDYTLWAEALTYEGRTVYSAQLLDEPVIHNGATVRRAKVTDEFIAAVALML